MRGLKTNHRIRHLSRIRSLKSTLCGSNRAQIHGRHITAGSRGNWSVFDSNEILSAHPENHNWVVWWSHSREGVATNQPLPHSLVCRPAHLYQWLDAHHGLRCTWLEQGGIQSTLRSDGRWVCNLIKKSGGKKSHLACLAPILHTLQTMPAFCSFSVPREQQSPKQTPSATQHLLSCLHTQNINSRSPLQ